MQPFKPPRVTDGTIRSFTAVTGLHISCILCLFLMLTSHFCFLSIPSVDSFFFSVTSMCLSVCRPGCYVLCVCAAAVFRLQYPRCVCTFSRRRSCCRGCGPCCWCIWWIWWVIKHLFIVQVYVWMCFYYIKAASASIGDSRTNVPPRPTVCPALTPQSWFLASLVLTTWPPNIHQVNNSSKKHNC